MLRRFPSCSAPGIFPRRRLLPRSSGSSAQRQALDLSRHRPRRAIAPSDLRELEQLVASDYEGKRDANEREDRCGVELAIQQDATADTENYAHHNRAAEACCRTGCSKSRSFLWSG